MGVPDISLDDLPDVVTVAEAADKVRMTGETIRKAIRDGELDAFVPRGREGKRMGRGQGYRIRKQDLKAWYFGEQAAP